MQLFYLRCLAGCLLASAPAFGVLIDFTSRTTFGTGTTLAAGLPTANGVDFTSAALCPTIGCAPSGSFVSWASNTGLGATAAFSSISGFSVQAFSGPTGSGVTKLYLAATNYLSAPGPSMKYGTPVMSSRDVHNVGGSGPTVRINLPTGTNSFAIDLSNGCKIHTTSGSVSGCDPGDNQLGTVRLTTSAGDTRVVEINDASNSSGEFTFYGGHTTAPITWIELSLPTLNQMGNPNIGSIVFTRIAFGTFNDVPEPGTVLLTAAGLLAIGLARRRRQTL